MGGRSCDRVDHCYLFNTLSDTHQAHTDVTPARHKTLRHSFGYTQIHAVSKHVMVFEPATIRHYF